MPHTAQEIQIYVGCMCVLCMPGRGGDGGGGVGRGLQGLFKEAGKEVGQYNP